MPGNYIRDRFLKKLVDPTERNKVYSRKGYLNLRSRAVDQLVCEFGSSPAWITLFGSILSSVFFVNWLLAINYWNSSKNTSETERTILDALASAGLPSMIAFFMILFLALSVAFFSITTSVDQYKLRKGLDQQNSGRLRKAKPNSPTSNGANEDTATLAPPRSAIYLGINIGIFVALIAYLFLIACTMSGGTNDVETISLLLTTAFLSAVTIYHLWTLTGKNERLRKRWAFASFAGFILILVVFLGIAAHSQSLVDAITLIYLLLTTDILVWFATNGMAYLFASMGTKANKAPKMNNLEEDARTLSRWVFQDITVFGAMALLELPLIFLVETLGCRLLVLSLDLLYSFASFILKSAY